MQEAFAIKTAVLGMDNSSGFTIRNYLDTRAKAAVKDLAAKRSNNKKRQRSLFRKTSRIRNFSNGSEHGASDVRPAMACRLM